MKTKTYLFIKDLLILLLFLAVSLVSLSTIPNLIVDSSTDAFIPSQSEVVKINDTIEKEFGSLETLVLSIHNEKEGVLQKGALSQIDILTKKIETYPEIFSALSITNMTHLSSNAKTMETFPLFSGTNDEQINQLRVNIESWKEVYTSSIISEDETFASIIITMRKGLSNEQQQQLFEKLQTEIETYSSEDQSLSLIGLPVIKHQINRSLVSDMTILAPIVALLIIFVLIFSFRKLAGVLLSFVPLFVSASVVIGMMSLFSITFTMATMLVPVLLLIVASAYAIHVMSHFYEEIETHPSPITYEVIVTILSSVIHRNRKPIILAGLTTAAGFIAQLSSPLSPFRMFGLLSAFGVFVSQLGALILLPALIRLTYFHGISDKTLAKWKMRKRGIHKGQYEKKISHLVFTHHKPVIVISLILSVLTIILVPHIKEGTNMIDFFTKENQVVKDTKLYNSKMGGSGIINVMITSKDEMPILDPTFLTNLESFVFELNKFKQVGATQTILPYIKRMNFAMNQNTIPYSQQNKSENSIDFFSNSFSFTTDQTNDVIDEAPFVKESTVDPGTFNEIPIDPLKYNLETNEELTNLIAQYLILYSGNLSYLINDSIEPTATNISIAIHDTSSDSLIALTSFITEFWAEDSLNSYEVSIGGGEAISLALTQLVTKSQIYSLIFSLLIVFILLLLLFRSFWSAVIGLIPVSFALIGIFASMALLSIRLDIVTSLLAALAIGIGVDYAIHYMFSYQRLIKEYEGLALYENIMNTTGKAIIINVVSVTIGFSGLIFSRFIPIKQMGILFCISMILSGLATIIVLPVSLQIRQNQLQKKRLKYDQK